VREVSADVPVIATVLRPRPIADVRGKRAAYFSTAAPEALPRLAAHLRDEHGADVIHASSALARRDELRAELAATDADVYLVELKAAAIDVVAEAAAAHGAELVLVANDVVPIEGEADLDGALRALAEAATREAVQA
jgi:cyclic 2,3-diphosphoglycerate synthetase